MLIRGLSSVPPQSHLPEISSSFQLAPILHPLLASQGPFSTLPPFTFICPAEEFGAGFTLCDYKGWVLVVQASTGSPHPSSVYFCFPAPTGPVQVTRALTRSKLKIISLQGVIIGFLFFLPSCFIFSPTQVSLVIPEFLAI